jgi:Na+/proline symporter
MSENPLQSSTCSTDSFQTRRSPSNKSRWWIPLASLVAGPVIAFALWAAEVFVLHPDMYPTAFQGDALATLSRVMIIGAFVGVVASVAFAAVLNARRRPKP